MAITYPIKNWAYITDGQIKYLLKLVNESIFNSQGEIDIYDQVWNYLNYRWLYISNNDWLLYSKDKMQVAFNMGLKARIDKGDDYIFAVFSKNDSSYTQEWRLLGFAIRGKDTQIVTNIGATSINIDLSEDESSPVLSPAPPAKFCFSFGFNHLFKDDKKRWKRFPKNILNTFNDLENNSMQRAFLCSLIKFAILNDNENISEYCRMENGEKRVTTSFDPDKFLKCLNFKDEDESIPKKDRVLNELPVSYMYPINIQNSKRPDCAMVFRKKGRGEYTQFIGKTILTLSAAQMNARICHPDLEDTWLSNENVKNENVNRNYEK